MIAFQLLRSIIGHAHTGKNLRHTLGGLGFSAPARLTDMFLAGESAEYIGAACLAVMQVGE